jgi:hypothetical protein
MKICEPTVRIDDDLLRDLKQRANREKTSFTKVVNQVLRKGMKAADQSEKSKRRFRQKTHDMGPPLVDLTKALALAAQLEDQETIKKFALGK